MVSEAIFPTNRGYICIEKWSQIFVSGIGSAHSESEEKSLFKLKISKKIHRDTFFLSQSMLLPLVIHNKEIAIEFSENEGGGSKAVWIFSENSSDLVAPSVPEASELIQTQDHRM